MSLSLGLLTCPSEVVRCKIIRALKVKVVHEPAVAERRECDIDNTKLFGGIDQSICLVQGLEAGVFCLDGINLGNYIELVDSLSVGVESSSYWSWPCAG